MSKIKVGDYVEAASSNYSSGTVFSDGEMKKGLVVGISHNGDLLDIKIIDHSFGDVIGKTEKHLPVYRYKKITDLHEKPTSNNKKENPQDLINLISRPYSDRPEKKVEQYVNRTDEILIAILKTDDKVKLIEYNTELSTIVKELKLLEYYPYQGAF